MGTSVARQLRQAANMLLAEVRLDPCTLVCDYTGGCPQLLTLRVMMIFIMIILFSPFILEHLNDSTLKKLSPSCSIELSYKKICKQQSTRASYSPIANPFSFYSHACMFFSAPMTSIVFLCKQFCRQNSGGEPTTMYEDIV